MSAIQIGKGPNRDMVVETFNYDLETGHLTWRSPAGRHKQIPAGTIAGSLNGDGYRFVRVDGVSYPVSRLIWLIVHGV